MNTETKTMKFVIESTATPVEKDGNTVVEMTSKVHADITNASKEQIVALLAYLGDATIKKTADELKDLDEKSSFQITAKEYFAKREEMVKNLRTALAKAMFKEMVGAMMTAMKEKEGEPEKPEIETDEEPSPDATVNINININVKKEDK